MFLYTHTKKQSPSPHSPKRRSRWSNTTRKGQQRVIQSASSRHRGLSLADMKGYDGCDVAMNDEVIARADDINTQLPGSATLSMTDGEEAGGLCPDPSL